MLLGDSIFDRWTERAGVFFRGKPYVNRGIGGQTSSQMLLRFRQDVIDLHPSAVVILAGTNDIAGNGGPTSLETTLGNLESMAELARAHGIAVVLGTLLPVCDCVPSGDGSMLNRTKERPPQQIESLNRDLAGFAHEHGVTVVDYHAATADSAGMLRRELTDDGLHPNAAGYAVMGPLTEKAVAEALAKPR